MKFEKENTYKAILFIKSELRRLEIENKGQKSYISSLKGREKCSALEKYKVSHREKTREYQLMLTFLTGKLRSKQEATYHDRVNTVSIGNRLANIYYDKKLSWGDPLVKEITNMLDLWYLNPYHLIKGELVQFEQTSNLSQLKNKNNWHELMALPLLSERPKILWYTNYYDGPLSGVCEVNGNPCWFEMVEELELYKNQKLNKIHENDESFEDLPFHGRVFAVSHLTNEQWDNQLVRHKVFEEYVSKRTDHSDWNKYKALVDELPKAPSPLEDKAFTWWKSRGINLNDFVK